MKENIKARKKDIDETLDKIEETDSLSELEGLERQMREFLEAPSGDEDFEQTRARAQEIEVRERFRRERKGTVKEKEAEADPISAWEEDNKDYKIKWLRGDAVDVINTTGQSISLEFLDFLVDSFLKQNRVKELIAIMTKAEQIRVASVTENKRNIILIVWTADGRSMAMLYHASPDFELKLVDTNKNQRFIF